MKHGLGVLSFASLLAAVNLYLMDRFGRKVTFIICLSLYQLGNLASVFIGTTPLRWTICKFLASSCNCWAIVQTWLMEFVGRQSRANVTCFMSLMYCAANMSVALVAYFCSSWVQMTLALTVPFFGSFLLWIANETHYFYLVFQLFIHSYFSFPNRHVFCCKNVKPSVQFMSWNWLPKSIDDRQSIIGSLKHHLSWAFKNVTNKTRMEKLAILSWDWWSFSKTATCDEKRVPSLLWPWLATRFTMQFHSQ